MRQLLDAIRCSVLDFMKNLIHRRLVRLTTGALLALLSSGLFAPSVARAGCRHVVAGSHGSDAGLLAGLEILPTGAVPDSLPSRGPSPCAGLSCSGAPLLPAPPAPAPPRAEEWGCLTLTSPDLALTPFSTITDPGFGRPILSSFPPERPPRPR